MRWQGRRKSTNVNDMRGRSGGAGSSGGGLRLPLGKGGSGFGCLAILVVIVLMLLGVDPLQLLSLLGGTEVATEQTQPVPPGQDDTAADFVAVMVAENEDVWNRLFAERGENYPEPTLNLFSGSVRSACGVAGAQTGPFYCPVDREIYLDLSFLDQLRQLGAPGDFAFAYVIAHETAHHVQTVTGIEAAMRQAQRRSPDERNELSVRLELQADCLAGVWGYYAEERGLLEPGDVEEGLRAAAAIGDDRLQERAGQRVNPETFTHGTSEQRATWFNRGLSTGDPDQCDTFGGLL